MRRSFNRSEPRFTACAKLASRSRADTTSHSRNQWPLRSTRQKESGHPAETGACLAPPAYYSEARAVAILRGRAACRWGRPGPLISWRPWLLGLHTRRVCLLSDGFHLDELAIA